MNKVLRNCAISGILSLIVSIPVIIFLLLKAFKKLNDSMAIPFYVSYTIYIILYVIFIWGFKIIGNKTKNKLLTISSYILIVASIIFYLVDMFQFDTSNIFVSLAALFLLGALTIPFGIGILKLKEKFGPMATTVGILNIIEGASLATIILSFIGIIVLIPTIILEIILMFKIANKL